MYRGRTWTMRQIAGFGQAHETNQRFRYLIEQGQTGLSVDFDMPTLMGLDSDDLRSLGEVGREGVAIDVARRHAGAVRRCRPREHQCLDDHQPLGLDPAGDVHRRCRGAGLRPQPAVGHDPERHPEGVHRPEGVDLPDPAQLADRPRHDRRSARNMARYNPINISGYHISEAGGHGGRGRLHDGQRHHLRRGGGGRRPRRRRLRPPAVVLLRLARPTSSRRSPSSGQYAGPTPAS